MSLSKAVSNCLCGRGSSSQLLAEFDNKLSDLGGQYLLNLRYDLGNTIDDNDMFVLLEYRNAFVKRQSVCSDCFTESAETICSRILRILYK